MKRSSQPSDESLIAAYRECGSQTAAFLLYKRYCGLIREQICKTISNPYTFYKLRHDVEIVVFEEILTSYQGEGTFKQWIQEKVADVVKNSLSHEFRPEPPSLLHDHSICQTEKRTAIRSELLEKGYQQKHTLSVNDIGQLRISGSRRPRRMQILLSGVRKTHPFLRNSEDFSPRKTQDTDKEL